MALRFWLLFALMMVPVFARAQQPNQQANPCFEIYRHQSAAVGAFLLNKCKPVEQRNFAHLEGVPHTGRRLACERLKDRSQREPPGTHRFVSGHACFVVGG
jgi:hypothetical protein